MASLALETVRLEVRKGVAWVTLNRPDALNAWTRQLGHEMNSALDYAADNTEIRALVLTGAGRGFSAGADLKDIGELGSRGSPDVLSLLRTVYNPLILRVREIPKPVIAAVNGAAAGIGCSLALAADLIVAAESSYFLLAFANIALGLDGGASAFLPARIGHARASEMALLAERIPARRALEWGLVNRVVPDDELLSAADELAERLASGAPGAYAAIKRTLNAQTYTGIGEILDLEAVVQQERVESADFVEGVTAFLERRKPEFTGG